MSWPKAQSFPDPGPEDHQSHSAEKDHPVPDEHLAKNNHPAAESDYPAESEYPAVDTGELLENIE